MTYNAEGFALSQHKVYDDPSRNPIFLDAEKNKVNIGFLLHIVNFFTNHLTRENEGTLFKAFENLKADDKPQAWGGRLEQGTQVLDQYWTGADGKGSHRL